MRQAGQVFPGETGQLFLTLVRDISKASQVKSPQVQDLPVLQAGDAPILQAPGHVPVRFFPQVQAVIIGQAHRPDVQTLEQGQGQVRRHAQGVGSH